MKVTEVIWSAMPCAARCSVSIQPIMTMVAMNRPDSLKSVSAMGQPSLKTEAKASQSGRHNRAKSVYSASPRARAA